MRSLLTEGNARFVAGRSKHPRLDSERRRQLAQAGQNPLAVLVTCSDSRVVPELLFDCGIGYLFVIRVAGNACGVGGTASVEYAVDHLALDSCWYSAIRIAGPSRRS